MKQRSLLIAPAFTIFVLVVLAATLAACAGPPTEAPVSHGPSPTTSTPVNLGIITQSPADCTFDESKNPYVAGPVEFTAVNDTGDVAAFHIWRIVGNRTFDDLATYVQADRHLAEAGQPGLDHPGYVANLIAIELPAGTTGTMAGTTIAGTYAIICQRMYPQAGDVRPFSVLGPYIVD